MTKLSKNGGYFSTYELHFRNNDAMLRIERDIVVMGKNDLIWTITNKLKFSSFANNYGDDEVLGAQLNFEILIDGFRAENVKSGSVCMVSVSINWEKDEDFLTPLGFSRSNDGVILLNDLDYQDNLDEETFSKARDILSYYLESYEELKPKC